MREREERERQLDVMRACDEDDVVKGDGRDRREKR